MWVFSRPLNLPKPPKNGEVVFVTTFFFTTDFAGRPTPPGHRQAAPPRHRGTEVPPRQGSNTQNSLRIMVYQGSQLDYVCGFPLGSKNPLNPPLLERNPENPDSSARWDPCVWCSVRCVACDVWCLVYCVWSKKVCKNMYIALGP